MSAQLIGQLTMELTDLAPTALPGFARTKPSHKPRTCPPHRPEKTP
jgi:hypothetical protein